MPEPTAVEKAQIAAEEAAQVARNAADGAEAEFLLGVRKLSDIQSGRSTAEANRLKSRLISLRGYAAWSQICADSRK
jgi:hypothetical protein